MHYFPAFIKMQNIKILIVGGGYIAHEKLEKVLDFTKDITIISTKYSNQMRLLIEKNSLKHEKRTYHVGDINDFGIVIVAVDDIDLQKKIYDESRSTRVLCNAVDSVDYCDFIFPSYIKKGDLSVAISTSGVSPAVAKHLRRFLQNLIPDSMSEFLVQMKSLRETLPKGKERMKMLDKKAKEYFEKLH